MRRNCATNPGPIDRPGAHATTDACPSRPSDPPCPLNGAISMIRMLLRKKFRKDASPLFSWVCAVNIPATCIDTFIYPCKSAKKRVWHSMTIEESGVFQGISPISGSLGDSLSCSREHEIHSSPLRCGSEHGCLKGAVYEGPDNRKVMGT